MDTNPLVVKIKTLISLLEEAKWAWQKN
jgi:hypothetical protein